MCGVGAMWSREPSAAQALAGVRGYGEYGACIQDPGAQAGAYVYVGSSLPYEAPGDEVNVPDSLEVIFVNHVGRHGARFLSSRKPVASVLDYLNGCGELTATGRRLRGFCLALDSVTAGRWGALDALGRTEQSGIGARFGERYSAVFEVNDSVSGFSSYVPRCVMSMDEMTHGLIWNHRDVELATGSGRRFSPLVRPFETDREYLAYKERGEWKRVCDAFDDTVCPAAVALRLDVRGARLIERLCADMVRRGVPDSGGSLEVALADTLAGEWPQAWVAECGLSKKQALALAANIYKVVAGTAAVDYGEDALPCGVFADWRTYFTTMEFGRLWECANLRHYLTYSANGLSEAPALMARPLLAEIVGTLEAAAQDGYKGPGAIVRFGHAETMMPLLSLMGLPGCRYVTTDWGMVSDHWMDWNVVPMASNLQLALCRAKDGGRLYLLTLRNEQPVGAPEPWASALTRLRALLGGE